MNDKLREYTSEDITVTWSGARCIHFAACVRNLPDVFDTDQKPWIQPGQAAANRVADVVTQCPTGALHFVRKDGGAAERSKEYNTVHVAANGPLYLRGNIALYSPAGEVVLEDTRVALCRCGASGRQPLCDGSHKEAFRDRGELGNVQLGDGEVQGGRLEVSPAPKGPLQLHGPFELVGADGERERGERSALCRCGASGNKPFCDGSHRGIGFAPDDAVIRTANGNDAGDDDR